MDDDERIAKIRADQEWCHKHSAMLRYLGDGRVSVEAEGLTVDVPIFMKRSLSGVWPGDLIQEFPD